MIVNHSPNTHQLSLAFAICCAFFFGIAPIDSAQAAGIELIKPEADNSGAGVELIQPSPEAKAETTTEVTADAAVEPTANATPDAISEVSADAPAKPAVDPIATPTTPAIPADPADVPPPVVAQVATAEQSMLILDGSGSMWQQIEGKTKIAIAREVVGTVVQEWPSNNQLGLMSYGHREKGSCDDIETLLNPAAVNVDAFSHAVSEIAPKGKTPLTAAVTAAAEDLKYTENKASIILISDGEETCGFDPCAAGARLEKLGIDFTAHVISFDVPEEKSEGLRCLAEATGGRFLLAHDAAELRTALSEAVVVTTGTATPTVIAPASVSASQQVQAGSLFSVNWEGPQNRYDRVSVFSLDGRRELTRTYVFRDNVTSPVDVKAPEQPGDYQLRYYTHDKKTLASAAITVTRAEASVSVAEGVITAGSKFDVNWIGPQNRYDRLSVFTLDGKTQLEQKFVHRRDAKSPTEVKAPEEPGSYLLRYYTHGKNTLAETTIEVVAAQATIQVPEAVMAGAKLAVTWTGPKNERDRLAIFSPDGRQMIESKLIHRRSVESPTDLDTPKIQGDYLVRYITSGKNTLAETTVNVTPATATLTAESQVLPEQDFEVLWSGPNNSKDRILLVSLATGQPVITRVVHRKRAPLVMRAPPIPGDFELRYQAFGTRVLASQPLAVRAYQAPTPAK